MDKIEDYYFRKQYSNEFKMQVCKEYIETGCTLRSLVSKYRLSSHSLVHDWLRRFRFIEDGTNCAKGLNFGGSTNVLKMEETNAGADSGDIEKLRLEKRIAELEKRLKDAEMKAIAYCAMVDIAEKELKVPIRKKFNTQP